MKFIPILYTTPMVQAIIQECKTMTRRVVKPQPPNDFDYLGTDTDNSSGQSIFYACWEGSTFHNVKCPYGQPGDVLWVRESFCLTQPYDPETYYFGYKDGWHSDKPASSKYDFSEPDVWKPSIHMPKEACRIFLKITNVRVERLQNISEADAEKEGIKIVDFNCYENYMVEKDWHYNSMNQKGFHMIQDPIGSFASLWAKINGNQSWKDNPWVWVIEFERITLNLTEMNVFLNNTINQK